VGIVSPRYVRFAVALPMLAYSMVKVTVAGGTTTEVLPVFVIDSSGPDTNRFAEALTCAASFDVAVAVLVNEPAALATASMVNDCEPPPEASDASVQLTVPFTPTLGAEVGDGVALTYVKPGGRMSETCTFVQFVCEL